MCWEKLAARVEKLYGTHVNWRDGFFLCPECGEPIYQIDWNDEDYTKGRFFHGRLRLYCPVCEEKLVDEGEDWDRDYEDEDEE